MILSPKRWVDILLRLLGFRLRAGGIEADGEATDPDAQAVTNGQDILTDFVHPLFVSILGLTV